MRQVISRFPVTTLILVQFVPFAIVPAYLNDNPTAPFIVRLVALASGVALSVELVLAPVRRGAIQSTPYDLQVGARRVAIVSLVVIAIGVYAGLGSYAVGIGTEQASQLEPILTPLRPWTFIAVGLYLYAWRSGQTSRRTASLWIGAIASVELLSSLATARMAPAAGALLAIATACLLVGFVRFRMLVAAMLAGVLIWPALAAFRNEERVQQGAGQTYGRDFDAQDRLRMDLLMGSAEHYDVPVDLGQPSIVEVVRYGLVPRAIDPDRPEIATGRLLNIMVGSSSQSSYTFMLIGNVWMLEGPSGLILYFAGVALLLAVVMIRGLGPVSTAVLTVTLYYLVWMGATYPDALIGFVQSLVSLAVAWLLIVRTPFGGGARDSSQFVQSTLEVREGEID